MLYILEFHERNLYTYAGGFRTRLLRKEKGCTGEGSGFQELEEKRAEAKIAQSIVQIPLMESYDLQALL